MSVFFTLHKACYGYVMRICVEVLVSTGLIQWMNVNLYVFEFSTDACNI